MKTRRIITYLVIVIGLVAATMAILPIQVCRDFVFICENTCSIKGYRHWRFGFETGYWYVKSPLERFVETESPGKLVHRWTCCAGTGKNIIGGAVLFGHGEPGAVMSLKHDILTLWIKHHKSEEIQKLYDLLVSDEQEKIRQKIDEIYEEFSNYSE